jgi:hypothetical protein
VLLATLDHLHTFWGRFVYTFEGNGTLALTTDALVLSGFKSRTLTIPLRSIRQASLKRFSWWTQFGLRHIEVAYDTGGDPRVVLLTPTYFPTLPVWHTNGVVRRWHERLQNQLRSTRDEGGP